MTGGSSTSGSGVNKAIQALAHRYCTECKGTFDELSKIIQVRLKKFMLNIKKTWTNMARLYR